jgi:sterol desaturase/sphingolipid hydroxylase (fatty acid hydroxylase superfamily)
VLDRLLGQLHDPLFAALPFVCFLLLVEAWALRLGEDRGYKGYDRSDLRANVLTGIGALTISTVMRLAVLVLYTYVYVHLAPWHLPMGHWATWLFLFVAVDLLVYVYHRKAHEIRVVWAGHQVHHSSEYFNSSVALRRKWAQWFEKLVWFPLPLLGVEPKWVFAVHSLHLIYGLFAHTERVNRLPRLIELLFVTPSHHRVHHGTQPEYLDKNYGSILIVWDRMFGTFQVEGVPPIYGLTTQLGTHSLWKIQTNEFLAMVRDLRGATRRKDKLLYVVGPPGWRPADAPLPRPVAMTTR